MRSLIYSFFLRILPLICTAACPLQSWAKSTFYTCEYILDSSWTTPLSNFKGLDGHHLVRELNLILGSSVSLRDDIPLDESSNSTLFHFAVEAHRYEAHINLTSEQHPKKLNSGSIFFIEGYTLHLDSNRNAFIEFILSDRKSNPVTFSLQVTGHNDNIELYKQALRKLVNNRQRQQLDSELTARNYSPNDFKIFEDFYILTGLKPVIRPAANIIEVSLPNSNGWFAQQTLTLVPKTFRGYDVLVTPDDY